MTEEEKEAIYEIEDIRFDERTNRKIEIILNLIDKLQKENQELKKDISNMYDEEVIISILEDEFNLTRKEALELLGEE